MNTVGSTVPDSGAHRAARRNDAAAPAFVWWIIVAAWGAAVLGHVTGWNQLLGHDELLTGDSPLWITFALFLVGWQVMVAAMMLPSSLVGFQQFAATIPPEAARSRLLASFLAGYALAWTGFGIAAILGDGVVHGVVDGSPWLAARPWVIGGSALVLAGGFELRRPVERRRTVAPSPSNRDRLRPTVATRMGADHGLQRLRHCWPLMLLSFAAGMTSLVWMAVLTLLMALQEGREQRRRVTAAHVGTGLLTVGALVLINPAWLPPLFPGT